MSKIILLLMIFGVLAGKAFARFGETPEQCEERYGAALTNLPGYSDVERVAIHKKDNLTITVVFFRSNDKPTTAGLIFYSLAKPFSYGFSCVLDLTPEDEDAILSTVEGQWSQDKPAKELAGPKPFSSNVNSLSHILPGSSIPKKTPISTGSGITSGMAGKVAQAVQGVLPLIYPHEITYTPVPISHNGSRIFSFRVLHGVAICSADRISGLNQWAEYTRQRKA